MDVAISGDRAMCLSQALARKTHLFAVASGFGEVGGEPIAPRVLSRLREEFERRSRGDRFVRNAARTKMIAGAMRAIVERVNDEIHARSASHEDYVAAGCSLTVVLLIHNRAYLAHVGSTAAYLARDGYAIALTKHDAFEGEGPSVLMRAIGTAPSIDVAGCSFTLHADDALVLSRGRASEPLLVVRYQAEDLSQETLPQAQTPRAKSVIIGVLATILFYSLLAV